MAEPTDDLKKKIDEYVELELPGFTDQFAIMADISGDDELMQEYIKGFETATKFTLDDDARSYMVEKAKAQTPRGLEQAKLDSIQKQALREPRRLKDIKKEAEKFALSETKKEDVDDPSKDFFKLYQENYDRYIFGDNAPNLPSEFKNLYLTTGEAVEEALQSPLFEKPEYSTPSPFDFPSNYLVSKETVSRPHKQPSDQDPDFQAFDFFEERMEEAERLDELKEGVDYNFLTDVFLGIFREGRIAKLSDEQANQISSSINQQIEQDPEKRRAFQEFSNAYKLREELINDLQVPSDLTPSKRDDLAKLSHKMNIAVKVMQKDDPINLITSEALSEKHRTQLVQLLDRGVPKRQSIKEGATLYTANFKPYVDELILNPKQFYETTGKELFPDVENLSGSMQVDQDTNLRGVYKELDEIEDELAFTVAGEKAQEQSLFLYNQARRNLLLDIENEMENLRLEIESKKRENPKAFSNYAQDLIKLQQLEKLRQQIEKDARKDVHFYDFLTRLPGGETAEDVTNVMQDVVTAIPGMETAQAFINSFIYDFGTSAVETIVGGEDLEKTLENVANFDKLLKTDSDLSIDQLVDSHVQLLQMTDTIAKFSEGILDGELAKIEKMTPEEFMEKFGGKKFKEMPVLLQSKMYRRITDKRGYEEIRDLPVREIEMDLLQQDLETFAVMRRGIVTRSKSGKFAKYMAEELMFAPVFDPTTDKFTQRYTTTGYAFQYLLPMAQTYLSEAASGLVESEDMTPAVVGGILGGLGYAGAVYTGGLSIGAAGLASGFLTSLYLGSTTANEIMSEDLPSLTSRVEASLKLGEVGVGVRAQEFAEQLGVEDESVLEGLYSIGTFGEFLNFEKILNPFNYLPLATGATRIANFHNAVSGPDKVVVELMGVNPRVKALEQARQDLPAKVSTTDYIETPTRFLADTTTSLALMTGAYSLAPGLLPMTVLYRQALVAQTAPKTKQLRPYTTNVVETFRLTDEEKQMLAERLIEREKREAQRGMPFDDIELRRMSIVNDLNAAQQKGINLADIYESAADDMKNRIKKMYNMLASEDMTFKQFIDRVKFNHRQQQLQTAELALEYDQLVETLPPQITNSAEFARRKLAIQDESLTPEEKVALEMMNAYHASIAMHLNADAPGPIYKVLSQSFENTAPMYQYKPKEKHLFLGTVRAESTTDVPTIRTALEDLSKTDRQIVHPRGLESTLKQENEFNGYPVSYVEDLIDDKANIKELSLPTARNQTEIDFRGTSYIEYKPVFVRTFYDRKLDFLPDEKYDKANKDRQILSNLNKKKRVILSKNFRDDFEQKSFILEKYSTNPEKYKQLKEQMDGDQIDLEQKQAKDKRNLPVEDIEELEKNIEELEETIAKTKSQLKQLQPKIKNRQVTFGDSKSAILRMKDDVLQDDGTTKKETTLMMVSGIWIDGTWDVLDNRVVQDFNWRFKAITHALEYAALQKSDTLKIPLGDRGLFQQVFGEGIQLSFTKKTQLPKQASELLPKLDNAMQRALKDWLGEEHVTRTDTDLVINTSAILDDIPIERYFQERKGSITKMSFVESTGESLMPVSLEKLETDTTQLNTLTQMKESFERTPSLLVERINQLKNEQSRLKVALDKDAPDPPPDTDVIVTRVEKTDTEPERKVFSVVINGQPVRLITRDAKITTYGRQSKTLVIDDVEVPGKTNKGSSSAFDDADSQASKELTLLLEVHNKLKGLSVEQFFYIRNPNSALDKTIDAAKLAKILYEDVEKQKNFVELSLAKNKAPYKKQLLDDLNSALNKEIDETKLEKLAKILYKSQKEKEAFIALSEAKNKKSYINKLLADLESSLKEKDPAMLAKILYKDVEKQQEFVKLWDNDKATYNKQLLADLKELRTVVYEAVPKLGETAKKNFKKPQHILDRIDIRLNEILQKAGEKGSFDLFNRDFFVDLKEKTQRTILLNDVQGEYNTSIAVVQGATRLLTHAIADGYEAFAFSDASRSMQYLFNDQLRKAGSSHKLEYVGVEKTYEPFGVIDLVGERNVNSVFEFANTLEDMNLSIALTDPDVANLFSIVPPEGTINYAKMPKASKASVQAMSKWLMLEGRKLGKPEEYSFIVNSSKQLYLGLSKADLEDQQNVLKRAIDNLQYSKEKPPQEYVQFLDQELERVNALIGIYRENKKLFANSNRSLPFEFAYAEKQFSGEATQTKPYQTTNRGSYIYLTELSLEGLNDRQRSLVYSKFARDAASKGFDGLMLSRTAEADLKPIADAWGVELKQDRFTYSTYSELSIPTVLLEFTEPMVESLVSKSNATVLRKPKENFYQVSAGSFLRALNNPNEALMVQSELGDISITVNVDPTNITESAKVRLEQALLGLVDTVDRYSFQDMTFDSALVNEIKAYPKDYQNNILNHLYNEAAADVYKQTLERVFTEEGIEATINIETPEIRQQSVDAHTIIKRLGYANDTNTGPVSRKLDQTDTGILEQAPEATARTGEGETGFNITVNPVREYNTGGLRQIDLIAMAEGVGLDDFIRSVQPKFQRLTEQADPKKVLEDMGFAEIAEDPDALAFVATGQLTREFLESDTAFIKHGTSRQSRLAGVLYHLWKNRREIPSRTKDQLLKLENLEAIEDKPLDISSNINPQVLALLEDSKLGFYKQQGGVKPITLNPDMSFDDFLYVNSFMLLGALPKESKKLLLAHYDNSAGVLTPRGMRQFAQEQLNYMKTERAPTFNMLQIFQHNKEIFDRMWQMSKSKVREENLGKGLYSKWNHMFGHNLRKENYIYTHMKGRKLAGYEALRLRKETPSTPAIKKELMYMPDDPDRMMVRLNNPVYSPKFEGTRIVANKFSIRLSEFKAGDQIRDTDFLMRLIGESVVDDYIDQKANMKLAGPERFIKLTERTMVPLSQKKKYEAIARESKLALLGQQKKAGDPILLERRLITKQEIETMSKEYPQESFSSATVVIKMTEDQMHTLSRFLNMILAERYAGVPARGTTLESLTNKSTYQKRIDPNTKEAFITTKELMVLEDVIYDSQVQTPMSRRTYERLNKNFMQRMLPFYPESSSFLPPLTYDPFDEQSFVAVLNTIANTDKVNLNMVPRNIRAAASRYNRSLSKIVEDFKKLAREIKESEREVLIAQRKNNIKDYRLEIGKYGKRQLLMLKAIEQYFKIPYDPEKVSVLYKVSEDFDTVSSSVAKESILEKLAKMEPDAAKEYLDTLEHILREDRQLKESVLGSLQTFRLNFVDQADVDMFSLHNAYVEISTHLQVLKGNINEFSDLIYESLAGKKPASIEKLEKNPILMNVVRRQLYNVFTSGYWFRDDIRVGYSFKSGDSQPQKFVPFVDGNDFKKRTLMDFTDENVEKYLSERIDSLAETSEGQTAFVKVYNELFADNSSKLTDNIDIVNKLMSTNHMDLRQVVSILEDDTLLKRSDPLSIIGQIAINSRLLELRRRFADDLLRVGSPEINNMLIEFQKVPANMMAGISDLHLLKDKVLENLNIILEYTGVEKVARGRRSTRPKQFKERRPADPFVDQEKDIQIVSRIIAEEIIAKLDIKQRLPTGEKIEFLEIEGKQFVVPTSVKTLIDAMEQQTVSPGASLGTISGVDIAELRVNQAVETKLRILGLPDEDITAVETNVARSKVIAQKYKADLILVDALKSLLVGGFAAAGTALFAPGSALTVGAYIGGFTLFKKKNLRDALVTFLGEKTGVVVQKQQIEKFIHNLYLRQIPHLSEAEQQAILQLMLEHSPVNKTQEGQLRKLKSFLNKEPIKAVAKPVLSALILSMAGLNLGHVATLLAASFLLERRNTSAAGLLGAEFQKEQINVMKNTQEFIRKRINGEGPVLDENFLGFTENGLKTALEEYDYSASVWKDYGDFLETYPVDPPGVDKKFTDNPKLRYIRQSMQSDYKSYLSKGDISIKEAFRTVGSDIWQDMGSIYNSFKMIVTALSGRAYLMNNMIGALFNDQITRGFMNKEALITAGVGAAGGAVLGIPGLLGGLFAGKVFADSFQAKLMKNSSRDLYSGHGFMDRPKQISQIIAVFQETNFSATLANTAATMAPIPMFGLGPVLQGTGTTFLSYFSEGSLRKTFKAYDRFINPEYFPPVITPSGRIYSFEDIVELVTTHGVNTTYVREETGKAFASEIRNLYPDKFTLTDMNTRFNRAMLETAEMMDLYFRIGMFINELEKGTHPEAAGIKVRSTFYDYSQLTPNEKNIARKVFTFYAFMRRNASFMLENLVKNPERFMGVLRFQQNSLKRDYDKHFPELSQSDLYAFRMPLNFAGVLKTDLFNEDGKAASVTDERGLKKIIPYSAPLPYTDLFKMLPSFDADYVNYMASQMNPAVGLVYAATAGKQLFGNRPLDQYLVNPRTHNFLRLNFDGYRADKDAPLQFRVVGLEEMYRTRLGEGKRRTDTTMQRLAYRPNSSGLLSNISIQAGPRPKDQLALFALEQFILPTVYAYPAGKVLQPFTGSGRAGKMQENIDRLDYGSDQLIKNSYTWLHNAILDMLQSEYPRIATRQLAYDNLIEKGANPETITQKDILDQMVQMTGFDANADEDLFMLIDFFQKSPYADQIYEAGLYGSPVDMVFSDEQVHEQLMQNFYYDLLKENK